MKTLAFNPYLPSYEYVPDGEPYVFGDRVYVFGSHDRFGGTEFCMNDYVGWSAPVDDLGAWRYEGVIYKATQDPLNVDGSQHLFAPDVQRGTDGRYYLYYCLHRTPAVCVAVCDTPVGKYEFYGHVKHEDGSLYGMSKTRKNVFNFDPGVLKDTDGTYYLYTGFSPNPGAMRDMMGKMLLIDGSYCVQLDDDMLTVKTEPKLVVPCESVAEGTSFVGHGFYEASSPRKIGGTYYMVYSSVKSHDLCYATCDTPDGDYLFGGVIMSNGDVGLVPDGAAVNYTGNNHGGLVEINGTWYIFGHRQTNQTVFSRQGIAEKVEILADGRIPQVEVTSCGLNQGALPGSGTYEARIACNLSAKNGTFNYGQENEKAGMHPYFTQDGEDRECDGNQYIANMQDGAWAGFKYFAFDGEHKISVKVKNHAGMGNGAKGVMEVRTQKDGACVAKIAIASTDEWQTFEAEFASEKGKQALYFTYTGAGAVDFGGFTVE